MKKQETSFGAFLDALQKGSKRRSAPSGAPLKILRILEGDADRTMDVKELMDRSAEDFESFAAALSSIREAGFVRMRPSEAGEVVELTDTGQHVADLAAGG